MHIFLSKSWENLFSFSILFSVLDIVDLKHMHLAS